MLLQDLTLILDILGEKIRPSSKAQANILGSVKNILRESLRTNFAEVTDNSKEDHSFLKTLMKVSNKLKGWGNQYFFCNDDRLWNSIDRQINVHIKPHKRIWRSEKKTAKGPCGPVAGGTKIIGGSFVVR